MYEQVEKPKENKSREVANSVTQKKTNGLQGFGFVDNRPKAESQQKGQSIAGCQQQVTQLGKKEKFAKDTSALGKQNEIKNKQQQAGKRKDSTKKKEAKQDLNTVTKAKGLAVDIKGSAKKHYQDIINDKGQKLPTDNEGLVGLVQKHLQNFNGAIINTLQTIWTSSKTIETEKNTGKKTGEGEYKTWTIKGKVNDSNQAVIIHYGPS
ncbi:MAG: hypothetical protein COB15_10945 [Flavobacteriales bacterium]|nr:MAG: hypothetical protein COB15_10945 [Flavobacteriales bacterium]